ncbi:response regulator [Pseudomonas sp. ITA]|uniref:response regulator n=1 Tax=Pseudomonas sp. ITA TaxID=2825841 RepID=UPI002498D8FD|nr:response regulator [Pseudomonas sp. ITA]MDI2146203.1 response regulator [Pseudomonas sp. ITA]
MSERNQSPWPSVLLVEDHPFQLIGLAMQLNRLGFFWIRMAHDSAEAVAIIKEGRKFDVLVCDQHLPDGLGVDLIDTMYRLDAIRYAILISGIEPSPMLDNLQKVALRRGLPLLACLSKPLSSDDFLKALTPLWPCCLTPYGLEAADIT